MSTLFALRALLFAGECFFGATLILGLAWLLSRGQAAAQRHLVWTGAFAALLVFPVLAALMPPQFVMELAAAPVAAPVATDDFIVTTPAPATLGTADVVLALATVWMVGVIAIVLKLAAGWFGLFLLRRRSVPHIPEGIDGAKFVGAPRWELRLRTTPGEAGTMTWGVFKSVVLLPKPSVTWPRERLEAVLQHEFAHVRRRDSLCRLIALAACAFYWPNPFVWSAARRMRCDGEIAADDAALSSGIKPSAYAEQLLDVAARCSKASFAGVALSMAEPSTLKSRVQSVLSADQTRSGVTKMDVLKVAALGVAVTSMLALARPSLAEAQPSSLPQAVQSADAGDPAELPPPAAPVAPLPPAPPTEAALPPPPVAPLPPLPPAAMDKAEFRRAMALHRSELRKAQAEMRRAESEIRKALADAKTNEKVALALKEAEPALAQARAIHAAEIKKAIADAHIAETVKAAMERARPEIERAMAELRKAAEHQDTDAPDSGE